MPAIMGDARIKEKFQDEDYVIQVEQMFREKFLENLGVSLNTSGAIAKLGMAWAEMSSFPLMRTLFFDICQESKILF